MLTIEANIAVRSFDPGKSVPLKAYTKFRIRGAILWNGKS